MRRQLVIDQALRHKVPVLYVNQVGGNDQLVFDGRSIVASAAGEIVAVGASFEEELLYVSVERNADGLIGITGLQQAKPGETIASVYNALVLGTRDYIQKCGFKQAVVGLSGGIDSAVTAAIAAQAIGAHNVLGVAMPSPYSSLGSVADAADLAKNLGIAYTLIKIEPAMHAFDDMLAKQFSGTNKDVTEENVQARIRGHDPHGDFQQTRSPGFDHRQQI